MCRHRFLWLACVTLLAFPLSLNAQTTTGTLRGYVKDQNGTPLAEAEVHVLNSATGVQRATTTRADGSYILPGLAPATYDLSVRHIGFAPQRRQVTVQIGATQVVEFTVQAGAVELQAVTVQGAPTVELRTSEVATNVTQQQIEQLPTPSRNFLDLAALAPGIVVSEDRVNSIGFRTFSAGGSTPNQVNVFVDGTSLKNDLTGGGVAGQDASRGNPFPRNAIQEYRVISQNFKAEYQKASSAIISATTRSGSNTWTGNAFFGYQNKGLVALDTLQQAQQRSDPNFKKPDFTRSLIGFSAGGPIQHDKLFFFGSYEGNYQDRSSSVNLTPPTGFGQALDTVNLRRYNGNFTSPFRETLLFGKLTYAVNTNSSLEVNFNNRHETDVRDFGGSRTLAAANDFRQNVSIGQVKYNRFWGGWLNEAKVDYSRFQRNPSPTTAGSIARIYHYRGQDAWIGSDVSVQNFIQRRLGFRDDLTYSGRQQHVFKGGLSVDLVNYHINKLNDGVPKFEWADTIKTDCWCRGTSGAPILTYDYSHPYQLTYATGAGLVDVNNTQIGAYVQDDWSPTSRLALNLGIRWDFESRMLNTDYVTPKLVVDTLTKYNDSLPVPLDLSRYISNGHNRKPFYGAFQPRLGFSYALDGNNVTTVFGGFGIYYDRSLFDFSVDEIQKLTRPTYITRFDNGTATPGAVPWQASYLTADTTAVSSLARSTGVPEAFLIDNKTKPPKSQQFSLGVRRVLGPWVASLSYQGQRGTDLFVYNSGNNGFDSTGHCCISFNIGAHGIRNIIYSTNDAKTWYDAVSLQLDRPYRASAGGTGWGAGLVYTYAQRSVAGDDVLSELGGSFPFGYPNAKSIAKHTDRGGSDERHHVVANWIMDMPYLFGVQFSGLVTLGSGARIDIGDAPRFGGVQDSSYFAGGFAPPQYNFLFLGGWAYRRVDIRFRKDFPKISGTSLGVTADVFNVFNFSNFGDYPIAVLPLQKTFTVGRPRQVISDPRRVQIGVEYTF